MSHTRAQALFADRKFGLFIHWGLYSVLGRGEWVMHNEKLPVEEYAALRHQFKGEKFDAEGMARLTVEAGMKYVCFTSRHHDGFCLFDSALTDYTTVRSAAGRDFVAEMAEACRRHGLGFAPYYSLWDWYHADFCPEDPPRWQRYLDYYHGQVRELCTNYGKLDIMWYDVNWPLSAEGWESAKMNAMVRKLQPDVVINNRSGLPEDFGTPEQHIRAEDLGRMWEACMTFNDSWGYTPIDTNFKSAWQVVAMLRQVAAGGGNLLLNIGPAPSGAAPEPCVKILGEVGRWMDRYGKTIYEATDPMRQEWLITGTFTCRGKSLYFHCNRWPGEKFGIGGLQNKVVRARLYKGPAIKFTQTRDRLVLEGLPKKAPDALDTVIELTIAGGKPRQRLGAGCVLLD